MITPPLTTRHAVALQASFTDATTPHVAQAGERFATTFSSNCDDSRQRVRLGLNRKAILFLTQENARD